MQSAVRIIVSFFLLAFVTAFHNGAKLRRDGMLNLYPFPRVGRAGARTWQLPLTDLYSEDYEPVEKRQLYAFPRVGRGDASLRDLFRSEQPKPVPIRRAESPTMWFGPRLGRAVKSDEDDQHHNHIQDMKKSINDIGMWFGPRTGRSYKPDDNDVTQNDINEQSEPEQMEPHPMDRKKREVSL